MDTHERRKGHQMVDGEAGRAMQLAAELGSLPLEELLPVVPMLEDMIEKVSQLRKPTDDLHLMAIPLGVVGGLWPAERVVMGLRVCKSLHRELLLYAKDIMLQHRQSSKGVVDKDMIYQDFIRLHGLGANVQLEWWGMNKRSREIQPERSERGLQERDVLLSVIRSLSSEGSIPLPITRLGFQFEEPRKPHIETLVSFMRTLPSLTELDLACNSMGEECLAALNLMGTTPTLRRIELWQNDLGDANPSTLGSFVAQFPALEYLGINRNGLTDESLSGLLVSIPTSITHLDVSYNAIHVDGAEDLALKLPELPSLRTLDLSSNRLGDDGVSALAAALPSCSALTELRFADVEARDDEEVASVLANALPRTPALTHLEVGGGGRGWGPLGMRKILRGIGECRAISALEVKDLREPEKSMAALCDCLRACATSLKRFRFEYTPLLEAKAATDLAITLGQCTALERVSLAFSGLNEEQILWAVLALGECRGLTHLCLDGNIIAKSFVRLAGVLAGGKFRDAYQVLRKLEVRCCGLSEPDTTCCVEVLSAAGMLPRLQLEGLDQQSGV